MSFVDEFEFIRRLTKNKQSWAVQQACGVEVGIGDDAAVACLSPGHQLVMTCDTMTEEIHFKTVTMRDKDIGYKAMAAAVSDIAAMGAKPRFALVSISFPKTTAPGRIESIYEGLYECANRWSVMVVGGDTTSSVNGITVSVTVLGEVENGRALLRSTAKQGDVLFATGDLGCSAAGLDYLLRQELSSSEWDKPANAPSAEVARLIEAHTQPNPQIAAGLLLQQSGVCHALNDISDGLASEAWEIAEASGVGIDLIEDRIPISEALLIYAAQVEMDPLEFILYGGEDYQLVGTMQAEHAVEMQMKFREAGIPLYVIGYVNAETSGVRLIQASGAVVPIEKKGYNHFG